MSTMTPELLQLLVAFDCFIKTFIFMLLHHGTTVWPSGLRRWLQAPVRKGVGSNPTTVTRRIPLDQTCETTFDAELSKTASAFSICIYSIGDQTPDPKPHNPISCRSTQPNSPDPKPTTLNPKADPTSHELNQPSTLDAPVVRAMVFGIHLLPEPCWVPACAR